MSLIRVREEQTFEFRKIARGNFVMSTVQEYTQKYPKLASPDFERAIEGYLHRALESGIRKKGNIRGFIDLALEHGDDFDSESAAHWFNSILHDDSISGDQRIEKIRREGIIRAANNSKRMIQYERTRS